MAVDEHNHEIFHKSTNEKVQVKAIDIVLGDLSDDMKERVKKQIPNDPSKTMGLYSVCSILKEAKYDLTTNVSVVDGMTNGAECIIKKIDYRVPEVEKNWVPNLEVTRQFRKHQMQVLRRQLPLRPAAAKTIHRCQGDTMNEAVVDLPSSKREHMHYVALSRLRSISGLHILNLNENKIAVSKKVQEDMTRLRENALLNSDIPFLYKDTSGTFKILFQNVRSLHLHFRVVASGPRQAHYQCGNAKDGNAGIALEFYREASHLFPHAGICYIREAQCSVVLKCFDQAQRACRKAIRFSCKHNFDELVSVIDIFVENDRLQEAYDLYLTLNNKFPHNHYLLGKIRKLEISFRNRKEEEKKMVGNKTEKNACKLPGGITKTTSKIVSE
ncbi:ATP-dependent DNA helicase PIF1, partial [Paramuricea clavata]